MYFRAGGLGLGFFLFYLVAKVALNMWTGTAIRGTVGDAKTTIRQETALLDSNPNNYDAYMKRGYAYYTMFNSDRAVADYTSAIALKPYLAEPYKKRAMVEYALGQNDQAQKDEATASHLH
jgi:tetratricopeptide (TPR) repeat protein